MSPTNQNPNQDMPLSPLAMPLHEHRAAYPAHLCPENLAALIQIDSKPVEYGYGKCSRCSCPGFVGSGYTCTRGGCGHHYDEHW